MVSAFEHRNRTVRRDGFGCFVTEFKGAKAALRYGAVFGLFNACDTLPGRKPVSG
jgi:hypothetical protein